MGRNRERTSINSHRTSTYVCLSVSVPAFGCLFSSCGRTVCFRERPLCTDPVTQALAATHRGDCRFPPLPRILALSVQTCLLRQKVLFDPMSAVAAALFLFPLLLHSFRKEFLWNHCSAPAPPILSPHPPISTELPSQPFGPSTAPWRGHGPR